jgi:hypothetical protein
LGSRSPCTVSNLEEFAGLNVPLVGTPPSFKTSVSEPTRGHVSRTAYCPGREGDSGLPKSHENEKKNAQFTLESIPMLYL